MQEQKLNYYCPQDELDEELTIDLKKIFLALWSRKFLIAKVFYHNKNANAIVFCRKNIKFRLRLLTNAKKADIL